MEALALLINLQLVSTWNQFKCKKYKAHSPLLTSIVQLPLSIPLSAEQVKTMSGVVGSIVQKFAVDVWLKNFVVGCSSATSV